MLILVCIDVVNIIFVTTLCLAGQGRGVVDIIFLTALRLAGQSNGVVDIIFLPVGCLVGQDRGVADVGLLGIVNCWTVPFKISILTHNDWQDCRKKSNRKK